MVLAWWCWHGGVGVMVLAWWCWHGGVGVMVKKSVVTAGNFANNFTLTNN